MSIVVYLGYIEWQLGLERSATAKGRKMDMTLTRTMPGTFMTNAPLPFLTAEEDNTTEMDLTLPVEEEGGSPLFYEQSGPTTTVLNLQSPDIPDFYESGTDSDGDSN